MKPTRFAVLLLVALTACIEETPTESLGRSLLPCAFRSGSAPMAVGEVQTFRGTEAELLCLLSGSGKAEYTLVPFYASSADSTSLSFQVTGGNLEGVQGPPNPALLPALDGGDAMGRPVRDHEFHLRLQALARRRLGFSAAGAGAARPSLELSAADEVQGTPRVGDILPIRVPDFSGRVHPCDAYSTRPSRVVAVTQRAIVVADQANPAGGFTDAEYRAIGETFDTLVYPINVEYFGTPADVDANEGRSILFFSKAVNDLTPPGSGGYIAGFFWPGDLFPANRSQRTRADLDLCPQSNFSEIFYLMVPDPVRALRESAFSKQNVVRNSVGTVGHEFEHLINASRRLYVNQANEFEESWLDEGLAHIAEELLFYRASGLAPRQNIDFTRLNSSQRVLDALNNFQVDNLVRFELYLEEPDSNSLIGEDDFPTRGAAWAFLRYAADRETGPDRDMFFNLVNSRSSGVTNLSAVLRTNSLDWMQDWTMAVYTDDAVPGVDARFTQPSWNFRSVMPRIAPFLNRPQAFNLKVGILTSGAERNVTIQAGGAAYLRFGIAEGSRIALLTRRRGDTPPESLRLSIVRTR